MKNYETRQRITGRFAPSPTGRMHLGNIWVALLNFLEVRKAGGVSILRIEDLDQGRSRPEYSQLLLDDLAWMGIVFERGNRGNIRQSERQSIYEGIFHKLHEMNLLYPCYCRRADLLSASAPHPEDGHRVYPGICKSKPGCELDKNKKPAWRLRVPDEKLNFPDLLCGSQEINLARDWGDFVVRRSDGGFAYQLACAVDDVLQNVNFVLRGVDLVRSTFPQLYIFNLLEKTPPAFMHVPLLIDTEKNRLSKRQKALDIGAMRQVSLTAEMITGYLAWLAGQINKPEPITLTELLTIYRREALPRQREIVIRSEDLYAHMVK